MDDETRTAIADLAVTVTAGFARMDRYFELQQAQHIEFRAEVNARLDVLTERVDRLEAAVASLRREVDSLRQDVDSLRQDVDSLRQDVDSLRQEFRAFRDWATREIADLPRAMRALHSTTESQAGVRRELDELKDRVDRLEERLDDARP